MARKIPMRKCVVTQNKYPKNELIRVVFTPENTVEIDQSGKRNGRGAYLLLDKDVILQAKKGALLNRALKTAVPDEIYETLLGLVHEN